MIRLIADTNIFLRFLLKDNPRQYVQARAVFARVKEKKIELIIPQIVIFEIAFALDKYYGFPKQKIIEGLQTIIAGSDTNIEDHQVFKKALDIYNQRNISFVDCFLDAYSKEHDAEIFTFDKNLKKLAKT